MTDSTHEADDTNGAADGAALDPCAGSDCSQVLKDVWLFLDNEMDPQARAAVQRHLDDCSPCLEEAGVEGKLKKLLHRTCSTERAPQELRSRLVTALTRGGTTLVQIRDAVQTRDVDADRETIRVRETTVRIQESPDR